MTAPPLVFDRKLARRRLDRARAVGFAGFLVERSAAELMDRLSAILRRFDLALDLGTPSAHAALALNGSGITGRVIRAAPAGVVAGDVIAEEEHLPFAAGSFDLIVSLLALQTVNDLPGSLIQIRRSLREDGLFIGCLLGGQSLNELRQAFLEAESELEGGASPRVAPFVDLRDMGTLLQRAGLALPVTDSDVVTVRYGDMFGLIRDLRAMGWTNILAARRRTPLRRETLLRAASIYAERFADADGRLRATFEMIWLSGWAPHERQQKPLPPGSARMRLADALGTPEMGLGKKPGT